jgi:hypothetical protein
MSEYEDKIREFGKCLPTYDFPTHTIQTNGGWMDFELWVQMMLSQKTNVRRKESKLLKQLLPIVKNLKGVI